MKKIKIILIIIAVLIILIIAAGAIYLFMPKTMTKCGSADPIVCQKCECSRGIPYSPTPIGSTEIACHGGDIVSCKRFLKSETDGSDIRLDCAEEGEHIGTCVGCVPKCCDSLKGMADLMHNGECTDIQIAGGNTVCSNCGNGICEEKNNEDYCNCPEDCTSNVTRPCVAEGEELKYPEEEVCCNDLETIEDAWYFDYETCMVKDVDQEKTKNVCSNCGDGVCNTQTSENKCSCPEDCANNIKPSNSDTEPVCAKEGESIGTCVGCTSKCCEGLKGMANLIHNGECTDIASEGSGAVCSNCGNGICEDDNNEDYCNCPEDCK